MTTREAGRYGASLVAFILGGYIFAATPISFLANAFRSGQNLEVAVDVVLAFLIAIAAVVIHPASSARRGIAAAIVIMLPLLVGSLLIARMNSIAIPIPGQVSTVLLSWTGVVTFSLAAAWLILRARAPYTFFLLLGTIFIGLAEFGMIMQGVGYGILSPVSKLLALIIGVGIAWAAYAMSRKRGLDAGYPATYTPPAVDYAPPTSADGYYAAPVAPAAPPAPVPPPTPAAPTANNGYYSPPAAPPPAV